MSDPLTALRDAGVPVDLLSAAQRAVLASLEPDEVALLASLQRRLQDAEGEVVAHGFKML